MQDLEVYEPGSQFDLTPEQRSQMMGMYMRQQYGLTEKDHMPRPEERQQRAVIYWVMERYEILRVRSTCQYYYRPIEGESLVFRHAEAKEDRDFRNIVKEGYDALGLAYTGTKLKNTVETLKEHVTKEYNSVDQDIIEISNGWYWDTVNAEMTKNPEKECFVRLFDNSGYNMKNSITINTDEILGPLVKLLYGDALKWIEKYDGRLPLKCNVDESELNSDMPPLPYFDFIETWACGDEGVYNDILKAASAVFMRKKPIGAFILTGLRRNGKSTFVKMLHMMLGRANTSSVRLAELHDPHKNLTLLSTMLNAPDEEIEGKDMDEEATANFKSMAAHEQIELPVMYSPYPQAISTDFVMFCPMNDDPEWKGNSASACNQRSLIIPFYADLSKFDNSGFDFEKKTFTAGMFQGLLGTLFAFAHYHKYHKIEFSKTMETERKTAAEESDNRVTFAALFCKWFVGYSNENIVFDEYRSWCDHYGYQYAGKRKLMFAIDKVAHGRSRTNVVLPGTEKAQPMVRLGNSPGTNFFTEEYEIPGFKRTVGSVLYTEKYFSDGEKTRSGKSVIVSLEEWLASQAMKKATEDEDELSR